MATSQEALVLYDSFAAMQNSSALYNNIAGSFEKANKMQANFNMGMKGGITKALGLVPAISAVTQGITRSCQAGAQLYDTMVQANAQISLINDGTQSTGELQSKVFQTAQRMGASYSDIAASVANLSSAAGGAFRNNDQAIAFTKLMRQAYTVAGATAAEANGSMDSLTQALADGVLRGDEFTKVLQGAPAVAQSLAAYMGTDVDAVGQMAAQSGIGAEVLKNAVFGAAGEIESRFNAMPTTFGQIWSTIKNNAMSTLEPVLNRLNTIAKSENFNALVSIILQGINKMASKLANFLTTISAVAAFFVDHWGVIEPIIWFILGGMAALSTAQKILNVLTLKWTVAQKLLNTTLFGCPLLLIVMLIVAVVAGIITFINYVGGLQNALTYLENVAIIAWDNIRIAFNNMLIRLTNGWSSIVIRFREAGVGIENVLGDLRATGLMILQNFINGCIDHINSLIALVNTIPGISIEAIGHVTFGTDAQLENEAEKAKRNAELHDYIAGVEANKAAKQEEWNRQSLAAQRDALLRKTQNNSIVAAAKNANKASNTSGLEDKYNYEDMLGGESIRDSVANIEASAGQTAANTSGMSDSMELSTEDLRTMRGLAEQQSIHNFVTLTPTVAVTTGDIHNESNVKDMVSKIERALSVEIAASSAVAWGV